jgi:thioredoxin-like negative regulator of GroEL
MSVKRLTTPSLQKLISGKIEESATCVIKFYSSGCNYCHNLKEYYEDISNNENYSGMHFFAFNVDDYPQIEQQLKFTGVPTISLIRTGHKNQKIRIMPEPENPNEKTWYASNDIKKFIERNE